MTTVPLIEVWTSQAVVLLRNGTTSAQLLRALADAEDTANERPRDYQPGDLVSIINADGSREGGTVKSVDEFGVVVTDCEGTTAQYDLTELELITEVQP